MWQERVLKTEFGALSASASKVGSMLDRFLLCSLSRPSSLRCQHDCCSAAFTMVLGRSGPVQHGPHLGFVASRAHTQAASLWPKLPKLPVRFRQCPGAGPPMGFATPRAYIQAFPLSRRSRSFWLAEGSISSASSTPDLSSFQRLRLARMLQIDAAAERASPDLTETWRRPRSWGRPAKVLKSLGAVRTSGSYRVGIAFPCEQSENGSKKHIHICLLPQRFAFS